MCQAYRGIGGCLVFGIRNVFKEWERPPEVTLSSQVYTSTFLNMQGLTFLQMAYREEAREPVPEKMSRASMAQPYPWHSTCCLESGSLFCFSQKQMQHSKRGQNLHKTTNYLLASYSPFNLHMKTWLFNHYLAHFICAWHPGLFLIHVWPGMWLRKHRFSMAILLPYLGSFSKPLQLSPAPYKCQSPSGRTVDLIHSVC